MSCLILKVGCCRMVLILVCHPDICAEEIIAEFESLWAQLLHYSASSVEPRTALKARLADLAHLYCDSTMHKECFRAINRLRKNDDIIITEPDKGSGVVLLNKSIYVDKNRRGGVVVRASAS